MTQNLTMYEEAFRHQVWKDAMTEEFQSIMKNDVWEVVPRPEGKSLVTSKWLFKIKHRANGSVEKHKARFVSRGFSWKEGIDYHETFAPVAQYTSTRTVIAIASTMGWKLHQMDVKTAFLNGIIEKEVFTSNNQKLSCTKRGNGDEFPKRGHVGNVTPQNLGNGEM